MLTSIIKSKRHSYIIYFCIIVCISILQSCKSEKDSIKEDLGKIGLSFKNDFEVINYNSSGMTDYTLDIEIKIAPNDLKHFVSIIENKKNFFLADTVNQNDFISRSNMNYPYKKGEMYYWKFYRATNKSYEYYDIIIDEKTNTLKFHYLDEE